MDRLGKPGFLYEVSWQVCNRLGGVHTVLETSAAFLLPHYGREVLYVGPDLWADKAVQAAFAEDPIQPELAARAEERGLPVRFGRWLVPGEPACALVSFSRLLERKNEVLGELWNSYGVDSMGADWDTIERILFGYAAGKFLELHYHLQVRPRGLRAVLHGHEWMSGGAICLLSESTPEIGTVYTPHGTALGRKLAEEGVALHRALGTVEPGAASAERKMEAQHTLEVATAKATSVLAAVSEHEADEHARILGRRSDLVTPNGYAPAAPPDPARRRQIRAELVQAAERFLGTPLPEQTRLLLTSGRYEFRNKGLGIVLEALRRLHGRKDLPRPLLFLLFVSAQQTGARPEVVRRLENAELAGAPCGICTHNLAHPESDPVLSACKEAGLENRADDPVKVIFVPVMLDRRDALFPHDYSDVLQACDLTVFPSLYEPWGYTPLESLAALVPTITTDLTGFGRFMETLPESERAAVTVLQASDAQGDETAAALADEIFSHLSLDDAQLEARRQGGAEVLRRTSWQSLIHFTEEAHTLALRRAAQRRAVGMGPGLTPLSRRSVVVIPVESATRPKLHHLTVTATPPARLSGLEDLARNLWWTWHPAARALFERLDAQVFARSAENPVRFLRSLDPDRMARAARDEGFLAAYDAVLEEFREYLATPGSAAPEVAYFCAEFGLHDSLPIYSGGLGVLAGDHLKSASDLRLPLFGVGLLYANGYFRQRIRADGRQAAEFPDYDPRDLPLREVSGPDGKPLRVLLPMPERDLQAGVWRADVGRVPLFLLDTRVAENDPADKELTNRLYPADREPRIRQELLLGMGGWRMLRALGFKPEVCHLNEGHSAFLLLERMVELVEDEGLTFAEAAEVVRGSTVFTTHTPVPAGHDRFAEDLMRRYLGPVAQRLGLDWTEFLDLGRTPASPEFSMTVLALRLSSRINGVSKLHGEVSRKMLADVWPAIHEAEAPVDSITNGVHLKSWIGTEIREVLADILPGGGTEISPERADWTRVDGLDDTALFQAHAAQKRRMLAGLRVRLEEAGLRRGEDPAQLRSRLDGLDENALWIGYARRFAPYKRATLLFRSPERLASLLSDPDHPVRVVFAGKAHPNDGEGADLVRRVYEYSEDPRFAGKVFFVEDYGISVARLLVGGVDVWLNTPTRPLEASGTSGMKAAANGVLNLSVLDGWWCEGHQDGNGWTIGEGREYENPEMQNEHDSRTLYSLLENEIKPLYFTRDGGSPHEWVRRMKRALSTIPRFFNTTRMVREYLERAYVPLARETESLKADEYRAARAAASRQRRLEEAWEDVHIVDVTVTDLSRGVIGLGEVFEVRARVQLGRLLPEEVAVELYIGRATAGGELADPVVIPLLRAGEPNEGIVEYTGAYLPRGAGSFQYGVRVLPAADSFYKAATSGLVRWA